LQLLTHCGHKNALYGIPVTKVNCVAVGLSAA